MKIPGAESVWAGMIPTLAAASLALLVGFGLGRVTAPPTESGTKPDSAAGSSADEAETQGSVWDSVETDVRGVTSSDVARAAATGSPRQRERALEDVLSKANLAEVKKALEWANSLPDGPSFRNSAN